MNKTSTEVRGHTRIKFHIDSNVHCEGAYPLYGALSWRGSNPFKVAYNSRTDGQLKLTTSPLTDLSRYASSLGHANPLPRRTSRFFPTQWFRRKAMQMRKQCASDQARDGERLTSRTHGRRESSMRMSKPNSSAHRKADQFPMETIILRKCKNHKHRQRKKCRATAEY